MKFHKWVIEERNKLPCIQRTHLRRRRSGQLFPRPGPTERRVEGIAIFSASHVLIDVIGVRQLGGLASELAKQTAEKAEEQQNSVLTDAQ